MYKIVGFDYERTFLMDLLPKAFKSSFPQDLSTLPKIFYPVVNNKSKLVFLTPIGLPEKAANSLSGCARLQMGGRATFFYRRRAVFFIVFALFDNLLRLSSPGKLPRVCVS